MVLEVAFADVALVAEGLEVFGGGGAAFGCRDNMVYVECDIGVGGGCGSAGAATEVVVFHDEVAEAPVDVSFWGREGGNGGFFEEVWIDLVLWLAGDGDELLQGIAPGAECTEVGAASELGKWWVEVGQVGLAAEVVPELEDVGEEFWGGDVVLACYLESGCFQGVVPCFETSEEYAWVVLTYFPIGFIGYGVFADAFGGCF